MAEKITNFSNSLRESAGEKAGTNIMFQCIEQSGGTFIGDDPADSPIIIEVLYEVAAAAAYLTRYKADKTRCCALTSEEAFGALCMVGFSRRCLEDMLKEVAEEGYIRRTADDGIADALLFMKNGSIIFIIEKGSYRTLIAVKKTD